MRRFVALAGALCLSATANAGNVSSHTRVQGVSGEEGSTATVRLTARVVARTWLSLSGRRGTRLLRTGRGEGRVHLGVVDSEARRGWGIERRDDEGAFYVAHLDARVRFTQGTTGELRVEGGAVDHAPGVDWRFACGNVPVSAYRQAGSTDAAGTQSLEGGGVCADALGEREEVPVQLAMHVGDETPSGRFGATYVFTAVPDVI